MKGHLAEVETLAFIIHAIRRLVRLSYVCRRQGGKALQGTTAEGLLLRSDYA